MGTVIKVQCVYPTPFWREAGLNGQATSDTGPVKLTFDNSPPDGSVGVMMGFIEGEDGRKALRQTADQRRQGTVDRRSEERRVGNECVSTCRSRRTPDH